MIKSILLNKHLTTALACLLIQQLIVASSTYFIARSAESITANHVSIVYLALFMLSLIIVYLPAYFCVVNLECAKSDAHQLYNDHFHHAFLGKSTLLSSDDLQSYATTTLAQESSYTFSYFIDSVYDITALILNIVFNTLVIAWLLDGWLLMGYALGMVLASAFVHLRSHQLKICAQNDQQSSDHCCQERRKTLGRFHQAA